MDASQAPHSLLVGLTVPSGIQGRARGRTQANPCWQCHLGLGAFPTCDAWYPFLRVAMLSKAVHHRSLESARGPLSSRKLLPPPIAAHLHPDEDRDLIPQRSPGRHPADVDDLRISNPAVGFGVFLISLGLSTVFLRHRACASLPLKSPPGGCKFHWHTSEFAGTRERFL